MKRRPWLRPALVVGALVVAWVLLGLQRVPAHEFAVVDGLLGPRHVAGGWTLAPPGLFRVQRYPTVGVELPLPQAEAAAIPAADGSRYGLRGWATLRVREQDWRALHAEGSVEAALVSAVRQAAGELSVAGARTTLTRLLVRDLEQGLTAALAERGLDLRRIELDSLDFLSMKGGDSEAVTDTRLLVVGLDGGDWEIIDGLLAEGKLPHLQRLIDDGVRAKLLSISPMLSPVIWTTAATGVEPTRHGILDFLVQDPDGGNRQPVTSAQRKVPTIWEMLSRTGVETGVVGWWASWPADAVRGYLVSDRIAYQLFGFRANPADARGKTWPPELYEEIRPLVQSPDSVDWERVRPYLGGERFERNAFDAEEQRMLDEFRTLLASGESYLEIALAMKERFRPQLEVVYFEGTDTIGHLFMPYRPPALTGIDPERVASFGPMVDRYYETADRYLGRLLEGRDESWTVMVLSDHGFVSDATRPRTTDSRIGHGAAADWHRRFGMLILSGNHIAEGARIDEASIYDIAPTVLTLFGQPVPRSWPGTVLATALEPGFLDAHPVRYRSDDPERRARHGDTPVDPAAADMLEKLQSLGYIGGDGGGGEGDSMSARNNAGVAFLSEGRYREAEAEFRAGLAASPDAVMLTVNLALALRLQQRDDEASALFAEAMENPATLRMAGHQLASMRMDDGELDEAEAILRRILEHEPDAAEVHNSLGLLLERRDDFEGAEAAYRTGAQLDPDGAMARNNLGNLAKRRADLETAESWYQRAIEADPYFMGAYNNLALVYQARGEMDRAIDLYDRALSKSPENAIVLNNLASLYYARGDLDEARKLWRRCVTVDPDYPSPFNNLASLEITAERLDEAERLLERALELDPNYGDARLNLGLILRARGDDEGARKQLLAATRDTRSGANAWLQYGMFELESGRPLEASEAFAKGLEWAPRSTELLNLLGEAHYRQGRSQGALEAWERSLALDGNQERVRAAVEELRK